MNILPTAGEPECPLQHGTSCLFEDLVFLSSLLNTRIALWKLSQMMSNKRQIFRGLGLANRGQINADQLSRTIYRFGRRLQKGPTNSRQRAVVLSDSRVSPAKIRHLHNQLHSEKAARQQLPHQLCICRNTFASKEEEFNTISTNFYCSTNSRILRASSTSDERELKRERDPDFCEA